MVALRFERTDQGLFIKENNQVRKNMEVKYQQFNIHVRKRKPDNVLYNVETKKES